jgi:hypothetical protein
MNDLSIPLVKIKYHMINEVSIIIKIFFLYFFISITYFKANKKSISACMLIYFFINM